MVDWPRERFWTVTVLLFIRSKQNPQLAGAFCRDKQDAIAKMELDELGDESI